MKRARNTRRTVKRPLSNAERQANWRDAHPQRHRAQQKRAYMRKRNTTEVTAALLQQEAMNAALEELRFDTLIYEAQELAQRAGISVSEVVSRDTRWKPIKGTLDAAERALQALTTEEIQGIKKIYGFDPVLNPLHIVMHHAKQNLAGHGFYRGLVGQGPSASEAVEGAHGLLVPPPTPLTPADPEAVERQQLLDNAARLERIRSETQGQSEANRLRNAAVSRSRF